MKWIGAYALLLASCGLPVAADDAPAVLAAPGVAVSAAPGSGLCQQQGAGVHVYLEPGRFDALALLPPPPAPGSAQQRDDLRAVIHAQHAARGSGAQARAIADAEDSCTRFAAALGGSLDPATAATTLAFATRVAHQAAAVTGRAKRYWHRDRPYAVSAQVRPLADVRPDPGMPADAQQQRAHTSYPSGHAALGAACAIVLARMVPERRTELFARGREYGASRVIVGAHFPSDVEAGRLAGTAAMGTIMQGPCFEDDFNAARAALRLALGLPPAPAADRPTP